MYVVPRKHFFRIFLGILKRRLQDFLGILKRMRSLWVVDTTVWNLSSKSAVSKETVFLAMQRLIQIQ